jgi:site-specific recombinase XerC
MAKPTVKQHLSAIRLLFDWLVTGDILATNPATSVRDPAGRGGRPNILCLLRPEADIRKMARTT